MRNHGTRWLALFAAVLLGGAFPAHEVAARTSSADRAKIELGRRLFLDPTISRMGTVSCAACHQPEHGFSDPRVVSIGEPGPTKRHSQTLLDLPATGGFHWDGEFDTVADLAVARLGTFAEALDRSRTLNQRRFDRAAKAGRSPRREWYDKRMRDLTPPYYGAGSLANTPEFTPLLLRLRQDGRYDAGFRAAFGTKIEDITTDEIATAIESYVLSLRTSGAPYDRFVRGEPEALSGAARRGLYLFKDKAGCAQCHSLKGSYAPLTDGKFHNTGVSFRSVGASFEGRVEVDGGHGTMSFVKEDLGRFKTPTLRDIARRPPYMHDGGFKTLKDVVAYYRDGGTPNANLSPHIRPVKLSDAEIDDIVTFLEEGLTSYERPGLGQVPKDRPAEVMTKILAINGRPMRALSVRVVPFGDRFRGAPRTVREQVFETDRAGKFTFAYPPTTHVRLKANGYELGLGRAIPDYVSSVTLVATPLDKISMRFRVADKGRAAPKRIVVKPNSRRSVTVEFKRASRISAREYLYVASVQKGISGAHRCQVSVDRNGRLQLVGMFVVNLSGGATEPIDERGLRRNVARFIRTTIANPTRRGRR